MTIRIVPYTAELEPAVRAFNARIAAACLDPNLYSTRFHEHHAPAWLPPRDDCDLFQEQFLALDDDSIVRGGYVLKHQKFLIHGEPVRLAHYRLPISEGIIDSRFTTVAVRMYYDALGKQSRLFGLGGGGYHTPVNRFLIAAGYQAVTVPFYFRVVSPVRFLRNAAVLRSSQLRAAALDCLAWTGLGWLGIQTLQCLRHKHRPAASVACERVEEFGAWADDVWNQCKQHYSLIAVRDRQIVNVLYPRCDPRFVRLKITRAGAAIGWAVLLETRMSGHKQFGNMHVGTLVDCLAAPDDARDVTACARDVLESDGVDLMVSNQASEAWCRALRECGFLQGPSNLPFFAAPPLAALLQPFEENAKRFHLNRGDGDGPINL